MLSRLLESEGRWIHALLVLSTFTVGLVLLNLVAGYISYFNDVLFILFAAWLFAESTKRPEMPATSMAIALLLMVVALLVMEPDFGQTMLLLMVWGALFFIAGMRMIWVIGLAGVAGAGLFGAYLLVPPVAGRIQRFMNPGSGATFQVSAKNCVPASAVIRCQ